MKNPIFFILLFIKAKKHWAITLFFLFISFLSSAQLKADFSSTAVAGCAPLIVNFNDISSGNPSSWTWDLGNSTTSIFQNPSVAYFVPGTYTVKLIIRNALGIDSVIKDQYITVYSSPVVNFNGSSVTGCYPLATQFTDLSFAGSGSVTKWEWDFGDGNFSDTPTPGHTYTAAGNYNVSLRLTNSYGCVTSKTAFSYIRINSGVKAQFTNSIPKSCSAPASISFINNSTGTGSLSFQWDFGDGSTSGLANPSHTYISPGNFTVSLQVTNATGCTDSLIKLNVIAIGHTTADFSVPASICSGTSFNLKNTSTPVPGSSFWDFGDGTFSNSLNPSKVYANAGNYAVKMIANFGACIDSVSVPVKVSATPVVAFSSSSGVSCKAPFTVNFKNASSAGTVYFWDFGDGNTSTIENPSHTYLKEGAYTVKLSVTNAAGCNEGIVKKDYIRIQTPVVSINNLPQKGCTPLTPVFTANVNSVDSIIGYVWDFGDGSTSKLISPSHTYTTPGHYTISLTYTTEGGCANTVKVVNGILIGSKPNSDFSANPLNACAEKNITFTDHSDGIPNEWHWFFGDGTSSGMQNPVHQYDDTGYFSVTLIAINDGCADTITYHNEVHINPPVSRFSSAQTCAVPGQVIFTNHSIGADSWQWDFGDGSTSLIKNPNHIYDSSGNYTVSLTVNNLLTGCSKTKKVQVKIVREVADFLSGDQEVCKNSPVKFTAVNSNAANIRSYTWIFGGGVSLSGTTNSISHGYIKAADYNVTLILKDVNGCTDSVTKPLAVHVTGPTAFSRSTIPGICLNNSVNFFDSSYSDGEHTIQQWKWNWGDGNSQIFSSPPFNHAYAAAGNYSVSVKVMDNNGCTDSFSIPHALIVSKPTAAFTADTLSCTSKPVQFRNTSSGPELIYKWDFGDGTTSAQKNPVHLYTKEGRYSVSLLIIDKYNCNSVISRPGYIRIADPRADFVMSDSVGTCPPLVVNFTNTSTDYKTWKWDFGDGTTSSIRNPSHFYSTVGTFQVVLTVSGPEGCGSQKIKRIRVAGPSGSFTYSNLAGCTPVQTNFKAHTGKNISFIWDFNDGTTVPTADSTIVHVYTTRGKYVPKMILVDASGCKVPVKGPDTIKVFGVAASFNYSKAILCDSGAVRFTNTSVNNDRIINYFWSFGDGSTSAQSNPLHAYNRPGIYNTSLAVTTERGCKDSLHNPAPIEVSKSPKISILGEDGACVPALINFTGKNSSEARSTSAFSWKWVFDNGNESTQQNPGTQLYSSSGAFTVKAIATNSSGCANTAVKVIDIYPLPRLKKSEDDVLCLGSSATLQVSGAQTYSWSPSTYLSCVNCANPASKADSSIQYYVKGTSNNGCVAKDSIYVTVKMPFKLSISKGDTLCAGASTQLTANGTEKYTWSPVSGLNNASSSSPVASPATTTTYRVIGSDSKGCFKDTGYIPVRVFPVPVVSAGADKTINVGRQIEIIPKISNDVSHVLWSPTKGVVSGSYPGITVSPTESMEYTIDVKNEGGCKARDKISIFVLCNNANVFVPNTFSPNGDGSNDIFYPRGSGVFKIKNLKVFNRWGEVVFEKSGFNANDMSAAWDGTYKGKKLGPDVFVYLLDVVCENNTTLIFKGNIALIK